MSQAIAIPQVKLPNINLEKTAKILIIIIVVVLIIVFWKNISTVLSNLFSGVKNLTNPLGNASNDSEIASANATIASTDVSSKNANSPWNPSLYQSNSADTAGTTDFQTGLSVDSLTDAQALAIAQQMHGSVGFISSNASQAYSAIEQCQCQMDVSHVADQYSQNYSSNLWDDMSEGYDSSANKEILAQIANFAAALPVFVNPPTNS